MFSTFQPLPDQKDLDALYPRALALLEGAAFVHVRDDGFEYLAKLLQDLYSFCIDTSDRASKAAPEQYAFATR